MVYHLCSSMIIIFQKLSSALSFLATVLIYFKHGPDTENFMNFINHFLYGLTLAQLQPASSISFNIMMINVKLLIPNFSGKNSSKFVSTP